MFNEVRCMNYNVLLVDDEAKANEILKEILSVFDDLEVESCTSSVEALSQINKKVYDLIFLDISMPEIDGLVLSELLISKQVPPPFIFVSAYDSYMPQAFKVQPFDFLTKPVDPDELSETIKRFKNKYPKNPKDFISLCTDRGHEHIKCESILYVTTNNRKIELHTVSGEVLYVNDLTLIKLGGMLPSHFLRAHKQNIVNMQYAYSLCDKGIALAGNTNINKVVAVGREYKQDVARCFHERSGSN